MGKTLALKLIEKYPGSTALELYTKALHLVETRDDGILIRRCFPDKDQSMRQLLSNIEEEGFIKHSIRNGSILKEWFIA